MNKKILVLCYDFGSNQSPNSIRWKEIIKKWTNNGIEVFVVTSSSSNYEKVEIDNRVKVIYTGFNLIKRTVRSNTFAASDISSFDFSLLKLYCRKLILFAHDYTWKKIYWPDFAVLWSIISIVKVKRILLKENIEHCIVVSRPFSTSLIPFVLSYFFKYLKWGIDYIDPFFISDQFVNNNFLYKKLNRKFERRILMNSHFIFVLNERIKNELINTHDISVNKFTIIPNIYLSSNEAYRYPRSKISKTEINVTYVGSLNSQFRSPEVALKVFEELIKYNSKIQLNFFGEILFCDEIFNRFRHLLNKNIFINGIVNRQASLKIIYESDFLLNIGNNNTLQEPSKLMDYISACKPIINITKVENDASTDLLRLYNQSLTILVNESSKFDQSKFNSLYSFIINPPKINMDHKDSILKYRTIENISKLIDEVLQINNNDYGKKTN